LTGGFVLGGFVQAGLIKMGFVRIYAAIIRGMKEDAISTEAYIKLGMRKSKNMIIGCVNEHCFGYAAESFLSPSFECNCFERSLCYTLFLSMVCARRN